MTGATVKLSNPQSGDTFLAPESNTISAVQTTVSGVLVLTLTGTATAAEYAAYIKQITFSNDSQDPSALPRELTISVTDGTDSSILVNTTIAVVPVNDAPAATGGTVTGAEDTAQTLHWSDFGVSDVDSATTSLGIVLTQLPANGTLQLNGVNITSTGQTISHADIDSGKLTFVPVANASGSDYASIGFQPSDGTALLGTAATVTINVTPVADAPTLAVNAATGNEDTAIRLVIDPALVDKDGSETLSTVISKIPLGAVLSDGVHFSGEATSVDVSTWDLSKLTLTPPANFNGPITLTVTSTSTEQVGGDAASTVKQLTVSVTPVNDAPVLDLSTADGTSSTGYTVGYVENGAPISIAGDKVSISDADNTTMQSATVTLTNAQAGDVLAASDQFGIHAVVGGIVDGKIVVTLTGAADLASYQNMIQSITYKSTSENPSPVARTIDVVVNDGQTLHNLSNVATSTITVTAVNDAPTVANATGSNDEDHLVTVNLSGSDVDGNFAHFKLDSLPSNGKLYSDAAMTHELKAGDMVEDRKSVV